MEFEVVNYDETSMDFHHICEKNLEKCQTSCFWMENPKGKSHA